MTIEITREKGVVCYAGIMICGRSFFFGGELLTNDSLEIGLVRGSSRCMGPESQAL